MSIKSTALALTVPALIKKENSQGQKGTAEILLERTTGPEVQRGKQHASL